MKTPVGHTFPVLNTSIIARKLIWMIWRILDAYCEGWHRQFSIVMVNRDFLKLSWQGITLSCKSAGRELHMKHSIEILKVVFKGRDNQPI
ncbi:MAG: hypothetical protein GXO91_08805 [FCB group bacterium]|nr:hypothetical protein [FCB group bacterium]